MSPKWIVLAVILAVVVVGGAIVGILFLTVFRFEKTEVRITDIEIERSDGESLDLDDVPLDARLTAGVDYIARYGEGGEGELEITLLDGDDEEILSESYDIESSDERQKQEYEFYVARSEGETFTVKAVLVVEMDKKEEKSSKTADFYVEEGLGEEAKLEEAKDEAKSKLDEAADAVVDIISLGVEAEDLAAQVAEAEGKVESVTTMEEAEELYKFAEAVIAECNARKVAFEEEQRRLREELVRQETAACLSVMHDYAYEYRFPAEDIEIVDLNMNDELNYATAGIVGLITAHTVPERAGEKIYGRITAQKQGGQWVVTDYEYGI